MNSLKHRQEKIQEKRKVTPWREFLMEVCSRFPLVLNKQHGEISRYPKTSRIAGVKSNYINDVELEYDGNFDSSFSKLLTQSYFSPLLHRGNNENAEYADIVLNAKHAYLSNAVVGDTENVLYSRSVKHNCSDIVSSVMVRNGSSQVFESYGIINSSKVFYSHTVQNSSNIWFSQNLINCHDCILCDNLENKSYYIKNKEYTKELYLIEKEKLLSNKSQYEEFKKELRVLPSNLGSENCSGYGIYNSQHVTNGYFANNINHGNNLILFGSNTDCEYIYDSITGGSPNGNHLYGTLSGSGQHIYCGAHCENCHNVYYSFDIEDCSYCFGCVGLVNRSYCIFNKQYTKEERYEKVDEIFSHMEAEGRLGSFLSGSMSPFYFNDTAAYLLDETFSKEEVEAKGYLRRNEKIKVDIPEGVDVIQISELNQYEGHNDQGEREIDSSILKKVIQDTEGNYYRIIPMEYKFLKKHRLPLPKKHRFERMKDNFRIK